MLKLDNNLLEELGLGSLPEDQKRSMLQHIYETLELRVGTNLANQMTDQQLEEFEKFIDEGGDANQNEALRWLETNLPNYKQVVNEVFEALKAEVRQMAPQLVAASQAQPSVGPAAAPAPSYQAQPQYAAPQQQNYDQPVYAQPPQWQQQVAPMAPAQPQQGPVSFQQPYGAPQPAQNDFQQAQNQAAQQGQSGFQPMPQGFQPAPQGFQPPQPPNQPQQYPPQQAV
jgi:hypothetical protein